jgi:hypothetical protein
MTSKSLNLQNNNNNKNSILWSELKRQLSQYNQAKLLELISELHSLSADNKRFIEAKVINDDSIIEKYRAIIGKSISTDAPWKKSQQLSLKTAKKAISDYKKATGNIKGTIDLMIYYVERGTEFTCAFGDIDENFYISLELVFSDVLKLMGRNNYTEEFTNRLATVVDDADGIGWGYYDSIKIMWEEWTQNLV